MSSSFTLPAAMRANVVTAYGCDFDQTYKFVDNLPLPIKNLNDLAANELLVKVHACGVNPVDYKEATGNFRPLLNLTFPAVLGKDICGQVVAVGSAVKKFKVGDFILSMASHGNAEYAVIKEDLAALKPDTISVQEAATMPVAVITMYQCFEKFPGGIKPEHKVLVHGGSGSTGTWGVLLAKHFFKCSKVFATCSTKNIEYVKALGADRVIDYTTEKFEEVCKDEKLNLIIDTVGETEIMDKSFELLSNNGGAGATFVTITTPSYVDQGGLWNTVCFGSRFVSKKFFSMFGPAFHMVMASANGEQLQLIADWIGKNADLIKKQQITLVKLEDVAKAHKQSKSKRTVGKLVVDVAVEQVKQ